VLLAAVCLAACVGAPATAPAAAQAPETTPLVPAPSDPMPAVQPPPRAPRYLQLPPPITPHSLAELRAQAALRLVAANPDTSYTGEAPDELLAIPVLEVELQADGSILGIRVLRVPTQAVDTTQLAIDAVRRAAPYGDVSHLPRPWKFVETFLFDEDRRFKPLTLDR
jgi:hypothetical protein